MAHQRFVPYMCHGSAVWDGKGRYGMGSDGIRAQEKQSDRRQPPVLLWVFYRSARVRVPPWAQPWVGSDTAPARFSLAPTILSSACYWSLSAPSTLDAEPRLQYVSKNFAASCGTMG